MMSKRVHRVTVDLSSYDPEGPDSKYDTPRQRVQRVPLPDKWPAPMGHDAYYGLVGDIVQLIEPESEADPAALLVSFLIMFGNVIGRSACLMVEETAHYTNEFAVSVGETAVARKGTTLDRVIGFYKRCEQQSNYHDTWFDRVKDGLSSGEGLIMQFVDPKPVADGDTPPPIDKRLMIAEGEFSRVLTAMNRPDNTLSAILRNSWDKGDLHNMTRRDQLEAHGAHLSILAHITIDELRRRLSETQAADGFGNRFLWVASRRSKLLPYGGATNLDDADLITRMVKAQEFARGVQLMHRDEEYWTLWADVYERLSRDRYGLSGALCSRGPAHVLRLSMIYALLDCSKTIRQVHLRAALEVWRYCEESVIHIFGNALGDFVADAIERAMRERREMTRTEIWELFSRNRSSDEIDRALALLEATGRIRRKPTTHKGKGRPGEMWEVK